MNVYTGFYVYRYEEESVIFGGLIPKETRVSYTFDARDDADTIERAHIHAGTVMFARGLQGEADLESLVNVREIPISGKTRVLTASDFGLKEITTQFMG